MAELVEVRIKDFRAFRSASLKLESSGLILVAGPNNTGKSALLSVFDVLAGVELPQATRHASGEKAQIWARWRLDETEQAALLGSHSDTAELLKHGAASWVEWEFAEFHGKLQPVSVSANWPEVKTLEFLRISEQGPTSYELRGAAASLAAWDQNLSGSRGGSGSPIANTLGTMGMSEHLAPAFQAIYGWRQGYFHFQPFRESRGRQTALGNITPNLEPTGANLPNVLLYLHNNKRDIWDELVQLIQKLVPGIGTLRVPLGANDFTIMFEDADVPSHRHNLKDLGTGVEQILMTLVLGYTQTATTVLLEEPETGLHSGAQRALLGLLQDWSRERVFIASTHSATMLDWNSPSTNVLAVTRAGIESKVAPVTSDRADVLRELGVRLSDVLSAERILILEGPTDQRVVDLWFPDVTRNPKVAVVDGGGGYNAWHADLFVQWLEVADQLGTRRVLYARDSDELSGGARMKLEASEYVSLLPCRELENLLLDFGAVAAVINAERTKQQKPPATLEDVAATARLAADSLKQTVVLKRTMADLEPIRLADHKLRGKLAKADADEAALKAAVLERVPEKSVIEGQISVLWQQHKADVDSAWEQDWQLLAPGADVLGALWQHYLGRGYSKKDDGLKIAREMKPPAALAKTLAEFMEN